MMKKTVLLSLLCLLLAMPAMAQRNFGRPGGQRLSGTYYYDRPSYDRGSYHPWLDRKDVYFGLRVGLNASRVSSDAPALDGTGTSTGLNVGVAAGFQLIDRAPLYLESGLYYTEKGGESDNGSKFTYDLNYLEVPLVFKYKYYVNRDVAVQPFLGGYLACGVGGKIKDYGNREAYGSFDSDYDTNFKRFDGGIKVGCGVSIQMLYIDLGYDFGLANVGKDDFDDTHNGCFTVNIGVDF